MNEFEYDPANAEHRFILAVLFAELSNERTLQLTADDLRKIYKFIAESGQAQI